jgi:hypothetical protein
VPKNWTRLGFFVGVGTLLTGASLVFLPLFLPGSTPIWLWSLCYDIGSATAIMGGLLFDISVLCGAISYFKSKLRTPVGDRRLRQDAGLLHKA